MEPQPIVLVLVLEILFVAPSVIPVPKTLQTEVRSTSEPRGTNGFEHEDEHEHEHEDESRLGSFSGATNDPSC